MLLKTKPKKFTNGKKIAKIIHDAVSVDIGIMGKMVLGSFGMLLTGIVFICSLTLQQVESIDQKIFKHLTNDEIHASVKFITPVEVFNEHVKFSEMERDHLETSIKDLDSRFCTAISETRTDLKGDIMDLKDLIKDRNYNESQKGKK